MSNLVQATPSLLPPPQSISENIAPGIIGLFVQGLESGIVLMQLSRWFYLGRTESIGVKALVLFVTTVGLSALTQSSDPLLCGLTLRCGTAGWKQV
jgi:hypothetical protein